MFSVVDAVIYENTLELVAAVLLGACFWVVVVVCPKQGGATAARLVCGRKHSTGQCRRPFKSTARGSLGFQGRAV